MSTTADIEAALHQALPHDQQHAAVELARLVEDAREGKLTQDQAQARLGADSAVIDALRTLAGKQVTASASVIDFGSGNQFGDITIGDVAGRDIIKLSIGTLIRAQYNYYTYTTIARSAQEQRNRRAMLAKVKNIWIDGLLNRSLTDELRIDLNLVDRPDLLQLPLNAVVQELERPLQALPPGMPISEVFDQVGGELLILGAPGAGKTTLLLELLRDLLARAERDEAHPIPVVFPLSTWAVERKPLKEWLVDQLNVIYDVPHKVGQGWVAENEVLPVLDGLDEVAAEHQNACVDAINRYRQEVGGLAPTAVASRIRDYEVLKGRLRLIGAVLVEPLTKGQVESYLERVGEPLRAVRYLVESDPKVIELLDSPLMLSVVALAFQDALTETLRAEGTVEEKRGRLWEAYIERIFARKGNESKYRHKQTMKWLSWLGWRMQRQRQTVYFIERMQPLWLRLKHRRSYYVINRVFVCFACMLVSVFFGGIIELLTCGRFPGISVGLLFGGMVGSFYGLIANILFDWPTERSGSLWDLYSDQITPTQGLMWSWSKLVRVLRDPIFWGPLLGAAVWLLFVYFIGINELAVRLDWFLGFIFGGLALLLTFDLFFVLIIGLQSNTREVSMSPNQGIKESIHNALIVGSVVGLVMGLLTELVLAVISGEKTKGIAGFFTGLFFGLLAGLLFGGGASIQHYTLRGLLSLYGYLPLRLVPWLDHCCDRLFLRRVGGGYIFIHRMLLEHFARKYEEQTK